MSKIGKIKSRDKKKKDQRNCNLRILIVCEGEQTEINYFNNFKNKLKVNSIEVIPFTGPHTDAYGIIEDALSKIEKEKDTNPIDETWCVFDADKNTVQQLYKAKKLAHKNSIKIIFSNPCFELWFLLHYKYTSATFKNPKPDGSNGDMVKVELKKIPEMKDYEKNICIYDKLKNMQETAFSHVKLLKAHHKSLKVDLYSLGSNPYTDVGVLVERLNKLNQNS
jgi:hypothetical protein